MDAKSLKAMQAEYKKTVEIKERNLHVTWSTILREYGLRNFGEVMEALGDYESIDLLDWSAANGRLATINVLSRKMVAMTSLREPMFLFKNENPRNEAISKLLEQAFSQVQRQIGWNLRTKVAGFWAVLTGTAIAKVGVDSAYMYGEAPWSAKEPKAALDSEDSDRLFPYGPTTEYTDPFIREGLPSIQIVPSTDIFYNLGVRRDEDIRRIYHRVRRPLLDVQRDSRYVETARAKVKGMDEPVDSELFWDTNDLLEDLTKYVWVVECYDVASRQYCVFSPDIDEPLSDWKTFPLPMHTPYVWWRPVFNPLGVWGVPWALLLLGQAQAINVLRARLVDAIGRDGKKIIAWNKGQLGEQADDFIQRISSAKNGEHIAVEFPQDGSKLFEMLEFGTPSAEILRLSSIVENDQSWVSGLSNETGNRPSPGDQTATEVMRRGESEGLVRDEFITSNEEFQEALARPIAQVMLEQWPQSRMLQVVGPSPELFFWVDVERQRILGDFTLKIVAGSTQKQNKETMRRQWMEVLPRIAEIGDRIAADQQAQMQGMPPNPINWLEVFKETLDMYDPMLAHRVLNQSSMVALVQRLIRDHGIEPYYMSPQLASAISASVNSTGTPGMQAGMPGMPGMGAPGMGGMGMPGMGGQGMMPGGASPSFEEANRIPSPAGLQGDQVMGDRPGMVSGRALSEGIQ